MANRLIAQLGSLSLPSQFSYTPYVPRKRFSVTATVGGVVTQASNPWIVHGDGTLPWVCNACYPWEWQQLYGLYVDNPLTTYSFLGYWGETLTVRFTSLDQPKVRSRLFDAAGQFQVVALGTAMSAACKI